MSAAGAAEELFGDPGYLHHLAQLDLVARQVISGRRRGERRSGRRGAGTVFSDYRSYGRGDDLRYVDWNVYGRLGALVVKQFEVEESANVLLFLDRSLSMDFGEPSKLVFGKRLAAALGYIGLAHFDRVEVFPLPGGEPRPFSGRAQAPALFDHLRGLRAEGPTDLLTSIRGHPAAGRRRGIAVLVSDFYDRRGFRAAVDWLLSRRHRVFLVQVFDRREVRPEAGGSFRLVDSEDGRRLKVTVTEELARAYRAAFRRFSEGILRTARKRGVGYARFPSDRPFAEAVLSLIRIGGIVR